MGGGIDVFAEGKRDEIEYQENIKKRKGRKFSQGHVANVHVCVCVCVCACL